MGSPNSRSDPRRTRLSLAALSIIAALGWIAWSGETPGPRPERPPSATVEEQAREPGASASLASLASDSSRESLSAVAARTPAPAASLSLVLVDGGDRALAGEPAELVRPGRVRVASGTGGGVTFAGIPPGLPLELVLGGGRCAHVSLSLAALVPGERRELGPVVLPPAARLEGVVVGADGRGLPDVRVTLARPPSTLDAFARRLGAAAQPLDGEAHVAQARTGADGRFELVALAPGSYVLAARLDGRGDAERSVTVPGPALRVELLEPDATVTGTLVDERGAVLTGGRVALAELDDATDLTLARAALVDRGVAVDALGAFALSAPRGLARVAVLADAPGRALTLVEGELGRPLEVVLPPALTLAGRVVDARGAGVDGATVRAERADALPAREVAPRDAHSDVDGRFLLEGLVPATWRLVVRSAAGAAEVGPLVLSDSRENLEVRLPGAEPDLEVRVVDERGRALAGVEVLVGSPSRIALERGLELGAAPLERVDELVHGATDAAGVARFVASPRGPVGVLARAAGRAPVHRSLVLGAGRAEIELVASLAGAISLLVLDGEGRPVPDAMVELADLEGYATDVRRADRLGRVTWAPLAPGTYRATHAPETAPVTSAAEELGHASTTVTVRPGTGVEAELVLATEAVLHVRVTDASGPVSAAGVGLAPLDAPDLLAWRLASAEDERRTDSAGRATLVAHAPGAHVVYARSSARAAATTAIVDIEPGTREIAIELAEGAVTGAVVDERGTACDDATAHLVPVDPAGAESFHVSAVLETVAADGSRTPLGEPLELSTGEVVARVERGAYAFDRVPPGRYRVSVSREGYATWSSEEFAVEAFESVELPESVLRTSCSLRGRVLSGGAQRGVLQLARGTEVVEMRVVAAGDGFEFRGLPAGSYRLIAQTDDETLEGEPFEVLPERENSRDVVLP